MVPGICLFIDDNFMNILVCHPFCSKFEFVIAKPNLSHVEHVDEELHLKGPHVVHVFLVHAPGEPAPTHLYQGVQQQTNL